MEANGLYNCHLELLSMDKASRAEQNTASRDQEMRTAPLFSYPARDAIKAELNGEVFPQHCLLAGDLSNDESPASDASTTSISRSPAQSNLEAGNSSISKPSDPRIFLNVNAPWSAFICGSQGSGKSYTLSCMLEACLKVIPKLANQLPSPLAGLVFHYDKHLGAVCEAAHLCSEGIPVTVLVSKSSKAKLTKLYGGMKFPPGQRPPKVEVLELKPRHLNLERMLSLMCVSTEDRKPLYIESIQKILRNMVTASPDKEEIDYNIFLQEIGEAKLKPDQMMPLNLRLNILESFLEGKVDPKRVKYTPPTVDSPDLWIPKPGTLTIVDLSDPFIDESSACALFSICLSLFLENDSSITPEENSSEQEGQQKCNQKGKQKDEQEPEQESKSFSVGKVVALDEAHKFMTSTPGSETFTASLISTIRLQRHHGIRIIIATQEPTISPKLMDLCTLTLVHKFSSPDWMNELKRHLPGVVIKGEDREQEVFKSIVELGTGEALLFCSNAVLRVSGGKAEKMGVGWKKVRVRKRVTEDGGGSVMAS